jgi:hypothetical protein
LQCSLLKALWRLFQLRQEAAMCQRFQQNSLKARAESSSAFAVSHLSHESMFRLSLSLI